MKTETEMIVAVLHDVVEDRGIALDDLRKDGYLEEIIEADLTHPEGEDYDQFIDRVNGNPLAVKVKIATWINFSLTFDIKALFIFLHRSNYPNFQLIRILCSTLYAVVSLASNFSPRLELLGLTEVFSVSSSSATLFT